MRTSGTDNRCMVDPVEKEIATMTTNRTYPSPGSNPPQPDAGVRISAGAPLGVGLLALLLGLGPASRGDSIVDPPALVAAGLLGAGAAFAALTLTEAATAWRARRLGLHSGPVVVSAWGPSLPSAEAPRDATEALALGRTKPLAGFGLVLALLLAAAAASGAGWAPLAATVLGAALLTGALTVLDLLPAPGRSGGLLVLARAWRRGDRAAAEATLARIGIRTGWVLVAAGVVAVLLVGVAGIWLAFIGWLTLLQSRLEQARVTLHSATAAVPVGRVMIEHPPEVQGWSTVDAVLAEHGRSPHRLLPMRRFDGRLAVVLVDELLTVPGDDRTTRRVQDLARPAVLLSPQEPVERLIDPTSAAPFGVVTADGSGDGPVLGVLGPAEIARAGQATVRAG